MKNTRLREYLETRRVWHVMDDCLKDEVTVRIPSYMEVDSEEYATIYTKIGEIFKANAKRLKVEDNMMTNIMTLGSSLRYAIKMRHDYLVLTFNVNKSGGMDVSITSGDNRCDSSYVYVSTAVGKDFKPGTFENKIYSFDHDKLYELGVTEGDYVEVDFTNVIRYCMPTPNMELYSIIVNTRGRMKHSPTVVHRALVTDNKINLRVTKDIFSDRLILVKDTGFKKVKVTVEAEDLVNIIKDPKIKVDFEDLKIKWKDVYTTFYIRVREPKVPRTKIFAILKQIGFRVMMQALDCPASDGLLRITHQTLLTVEDDAKLEPSPIIELNDLLNGAVFENPQKVLTIEQTKGLKDLIGAVFSEDSKSWIDVDATSSDSPTHIDDFEPGNYSVSSSDLVDECIMEPGLKYGGTKMKIEKEIETNKEVIGNQNKNNGGTKMKDALKKMMGNLEFGEADLDEVRMTMAGTLAFNDGEDNWLSFNPVTKSLVNNLEMVVEMPGFKMPKLRNQLQIGELITINNGMDYGFIVDIKPAHLKVLKKNGSVSTIKEIGNIMGTQSFYTVVKSINDFTGQAQNGMAFNPMMLAFMKNDDEDGEKDSSEMMKLFAMQGIFMNQAAVPNGGVAQNPMANMMANPMMLATLAGGKGKGSSMEEIMKLSMMSQFMQMGMVAQPGLVQETNTAELTKVLNETATEDSNDSDNVGDGSTETK